MADDKDCVLVLCNAPNGDVAGEIARSLVSTGLAACVNILGECRSIYSWEGEIEDERETPMLIKTTADRFEKTKERVVELHPYDVPEVIAVPISGGHEPYLKFVRESCAGA